MNEEADLSLTSIKKEACHVDPRWWWNLKLEWHPAPVVK